MKHETGWACFVGQALKVILKGYDLKKLTRRYKRYKLDFIHRRYLYLRLARLTNRFCPLISNLYPIQQIFYSFAE